MRILLSILSLFTISLFGQNFSHYGYVYNSYGRGMHNVPVKLYTTQKSTYVENNISYNYYSTGGTNIYLGDDQTRTGISIGFTFEYFGNSYTTVNICSNGWISFSSTGGNIVGYSANSTIPNGIHGVATDLYPISGYYIKYYTTGSYPNRKFVVSYHTGYYGCFGSLFTDFQIVLYETSNYIDINVLRHPGCSSRAASQGLSNSSNTVRIMSSGRNGTNSWSGTTYSSKRFTPQQASTSQTLQSTVYTNTSGYYSFSTSLSTAAYNFNITVDTVYPKTQIPLSQTTLQNLIMKSQTPSGEDYYLYDVDKSGDFTISDLYTIYAVRSGRFLDFPTSNPRSILFTQSQINTINAATTDLRSSYPGSGRLSNNNVSSGSRSNFYIIPTGYPNQSTSF